MDGRTGLCLLFAGCVSGCLPGHLLPGSSQSSGQGSMVAPPSPLGDSALPITRDGTPKELKPATLVSLGAFREQMAEQLAKNPADRERVMNEARIAYAQAIKSDPKYVPAYIGMARHWEKVDQHEKAVHTYQEALKLAPRESGLWFEVGMCHARHREWEPALANIVKAIELDRDNRKFISSHALCLYLAGQREDGLARLKKLYGEAEAHYNLAWMLHRMQENDEARQQLQLALQADPKLTDARTLLARLASAPQAAPSAQAEISPTVRRE
jgi:tetratricopeptide (TPR) repeat protein